jgi:mono/diheme cytochrome c family protein
MMRSFFFLSVCLFGFSSFSQEGWVAPESSKTTVNPYEGNVIATQKGERLFQKLCWSCHGRGGLGDGPAGGALSPKPRNFTLASVQEQKDGELFWKISTGNGMMVPYKHSLNKELRWQLVNYIRTFKQ